MKKEHIKSFILILLIVNSIQLTAQIWINDSLGAGGLEALYGDTPILYKIFPFLNNKDEMMSEEQLYYRATMPRRIIVNGGGAREVYNIDSNEYQTTSSYIDKVIAEFKTSNVTVQKMEYEDWKNLFKGKSIYVDFGYVLDSNSLNVLYDAGNSQGKFEQFSKSSGYILTPDTVKNTCTLTFLDETDNSVYEHKFSYDGTELAKYIDDVTYNKQQNHTFAFEINLDTSSPDMGSVERMVELSPLVLLSISADTESTKNIISEPIFENTAELERFAEKTLPIFGYNSSSLRKTVQSDGIVVYVENNATIKYYPDGIVEYSSVSKDSGMKLSDSNDCSQAVSDTLRVVSQICDAVDIGNGYMDLHLNSALANGKDNKYTVKLNHMYNGTSVNYKDSSNAAVFAEIEDGYITKFVMNFAKLSEAETETDIIPVLAAIDTLYAGRNDKMIIEDVYKCYHLAEYGETAAKWAFKVRGTDELLIIDADIDM